MPKLLKRIVTHLTFYVVVAILAGIFLGHFAPAEAVKFQFLGDWFIAIIKVFIAPIIFLTITLGIGSMGDLKKVGKIGAKALLYFEIVTTLSLALGVAVALLLKPGDIDKSGLALQDPHKYTSRAGEPFSWWTFLQGNTTLQILLAAIVVGVVLSKSNQRAMFVEKLEIASKYVFKALKYVMFLAPFGAFGGMAYTVGKFGLATILPLAKLMGCMYLTMALFVVLVLGGIMRYYKLSIFRFLAFIEEEILIVLGTSSSETAMPGLMYKLEHLGCKKSVVGLVVPTGYSFNLDGTSIYLSMAALFLAQLYNVHLSWGEIGMLIGILMLTSKGAAGVTGRGFIVLASTLASMHTIPLEGLAFLLGVDKFMSEARAITNLIGNGVATLVIARSEGDLDMREAKRIGI
jgi:aerobic C4-dicarboxylate transport protein